MINTTPKITVLMPVYNNEKYLRPAIDSILNQTFADFEFLIINDGSTDQSEEIIKSYRDERIRYDKNEINSGIIVTLNKGIDMARGEYIVRMDGDDISLPSRLQIQFDFMEKNQNLGVSGGRIESIGKITGYSPKTLTEPEQIKANLIFGTPFSHPSVIIRKKILIDNNLRFDKDYPHAEDYELWTRVAELSRLGNSDKKIIKYRLHDESICGKYSDEQAKSAEKIRIKLLAKLDIIANPEELALHQTLKKLKNFSKEDFFNKLEAWLIKLIEANQKTSVYEKESFEYIIKKRWLNSCYANTDLGIWVLKRYFKSTLSQKLISQDSKKILKFITKLILKK
jgi:glycosyltransferase involved in cell wall biosynthesis